MPIQFMPFFCKLFDKSLQLNLETKRKHKVNEGSLVEESLVDSFLKWPNSGVNENNTSNGHWKTLKNYLIQLIQV